MTQVIRKLLRVQNNILNTCLTPFKSSSNNAYQISQKTLNLNEKDNPLKSKFLADSIKLNIVDLQDGLNNVNLSKEMPYVWLRDNCKCEKCLDAKVLEMKYDFTDESIDIKPIYITQLPNDANNNSFFEINCTLNIE
jgi:hypothetical protein